MRKIIPFLILLITTYAGGQTPAYTNVTAQLIDGQGQTWANASWTATIIPPFGNPSPLNNTGVSVLGTLSGVADSSGNISVTLDDNTVVKPSGSVWQFTLCPNATVRVCSTAYEVISGTNMNLSASLSSFLTNINVIAAPSVNRAYVDSEATGGQGSIYWRTSDNTLRGYNGSAWVNIGSGGGGSSSWSSLTPPTANINLAMGGFSTIFNLGNTGTTNAAFDVTDASNNTGTNYLFRVWTGSGSTAKTVAFCSNNTANCIQMSNGTMNAIGNAQLIATGINNTTSGVGQMSFGANGPGTGGAANTVTIGGNILKLYATENGSALLKVLLGSQLTCATGVVQSTDTAGNVTCLNVAKIVCAGTSAFTVSNGGTSPFAVETCGLPSAYMNTLGKTFRITASTSFSPAVASTSTHYIGFGSTSTLGVWNSIVGASSAATNWVDNVTITCTTTLTGASGALYCSNTHASAGSNTFTNTVNSFFTVDLTGNLFIGTGCAFGTANVSNTCQTQQFSVELVN